MKRGFPRPGFKVDALRTRRPDGDTYEGTWGGKTFPLPYSSQEDKISENNRGRMKECILFKKCVACGDPVGGDIVGLLFYNPDSEYAQFNYTDWVHAETGPFHFKCLRLTITMCPHIVEGDTFLPGSGEWKIVKPMVEEHYRW